MVINALDGFSGQTVNSKSRQTNEKEGDARRGNPFLPITIDGRDMVSLSDSVPQPLNAKTLLATAITADKLQTQIPLKRHETAEISESQIYRALVAMKLYSSTGAELTKDVWTGLPTPSPEEMEVAYRRLTQRVVGGAEVQDNDAEYARQLRSDLLDFFRDTDWKNFNLFTETEIRTSA